MGNLISLFSKFCERDPEPLEIHDVDVVCCSTVQESSSESGEEPLGKDAHAGAVQRHRSPRRSVS